MNAQMQKEITTSTFRRDEDSFASLAIEAWKTINGIAPAQACPPGTELFHQDSPVQDVYFIEHGIVKLIHLEPDGREIIVGLRTPGWMLAAAAVIVHKPHLATGTTLSQCRLRRVPSAVFRHLLHTDEEFSWLVHQMHSHEVFDQVARLAQLSCESARHRFEQLLWHLIAAAEPDGLKKETKLALPLKQWEVAQLIAVTPAYLSRIYNKLEREGILHRSNGWVIIHDPQKLWHSRDC